MEYKKNNQLKILSLGNIDYSKCVDLQKKLQKEIIDIKLFNRKNNFLDVSLLGRLPNIYLGQSDL